MALTIDITNANDVPPSLVDAAVTMVLSKFPAKEIEEIWFQDLDTLIIERFGKTRVSLPFEFIRVH